jgi:hypothetical protein
MLSIVTMTAGVILFHKIVILLLDTARNYKTTIFKSEHI